MIFEEGAWMDDDDGKTLEASLFNTSLQRVESRKKTARSAILKPEDNEFMQGSMTLQKPFAKKGQKRKSRSSSAVENCKMTVNDVDQKPMPSNKSSKLPPEHSPAKKKKRQRVKNSTGLPIQKWSQSIGTEADNILGSKLQKDSNQSLPIIDNETLQLELSEKILPNKSSSESHLIRIRKLELAKLLDKDSVRKQRNRKFEKSNVSNHVNTEKLPKRSLEPKEKTIKEEPSRSIALRKAVTSKLEGAHFRFINEQLYTRSSAEAKRLFSKDRTTFETYHSGFMNQVSKWPVNPLDLIISQIKKKPASWVIGDFGCGDARLADSVKNKVHSFDLVAVNKRVTVADIAHVPLQNDSLDVVVLCLSLMGTNYIDFIREANRTLKTRGVLLIAEVASRFRSFPKFHNLMKNLGFQIKKDNRKNTHFVLFDFMKVRNPNKEIKVGSGILKPCIYKKR